MNPRLLKFLIYFSGIISLIIFLSIRIAPETSMNLLLKVKTYPEYEDSTKYGELFYINMINYFKEDIPPPIRKYRFSPEHPELNESDIIVFGDSHFDHSRNITLPEQLSIELGKNVYYHRINRPFWGNALAFLKTLNYEPMENRVFIYGTTERFIAERFMTSYKPMIMKQDDKLHRFVLNNLLFIDNTENLYGTILRRSYLTHDIFASIATLKFRVFNYITDLTPVYRIDPDNGSWVFFHEAIEHMENKYTDEDISIMAENIKDMADQMKELYNLDFILVPVPENYTINHQVTKNDYSYDFLPRLYLELERQGVAHVRLYDDFINSSRLVYHRTDTHWNISGVKIALNKIIDKMNSPTNQHKVNNF